MQLTFNKHTALYIMRAMRSGKDRGQSRMLGRRSNMLVPDPSPKRRWTRKSFRQLAANVPFSLGSEPFEVAVPCKSARIRTEGVSCTIYDGGLPANAFVNLDNGICISSPELLFVELAAEMDPVEHLMLGHELCGTFARDADDPYNGPVAFEVPPLTSASKIERFLAHAKNIRGIGVARASLACLNDNAWSPTESVISAFLRLPIGCLGFDFGELVLNPRVDLAQPLPGAKKKRYPDIMVADTPVGINYDGLVHLDLNSIVKAAAHMGAQPGLMQAQSEVDQAVARVREKVLDDIRRNRELATSGLSILPVLMEDLYAPDGLEQIAMELVRLLERLAGRDMAIQRLVLEGKVLSKERHRKLLSLLPGKHVRDVQICRRIGDLLVYESVDSPGVSECWVEL